MAESETPKSGEVAALALPVVDPLAAAKTVQAMLTGQVPFDTRSFLTAVLSLISHLADAVLPATPKPSDPNQPLAVAGPIVLQVPTYSEATVITALECYIQQQEGTVQATGRLDRLPFSSDQLAAVLLHLILEMIKRKIFG